MHEAKLLFQENFAFAVEHRLAGPTALAAVQLALAALQEEDFASVERWRSEARKYLQALDEKIFADNYSYLGARIGLHGGDPGPAEHFLAIWGGYTHGTNFRARQSVGSIRCLSQLLSSGRVDPDLVEELVKEFEQHCGLGQQDFFAYALYSGLVATGDSTRAAQMLTDYITCRRRDRSPLLPSLAAKVKLLNLS